MNGIDLIRNEREEQVSKHKRTIESDLMQNTGYQLTIGAAALLDPVMNQYGDTYKDKQKPQGWIWDVWRKMCGKTYKQRLIIAGALIAAEIDRLNLKEGRQEVI